MECQRFDWKLWCHPTPLDVMEIDRKDKSLIGELFQMYFLGVIARWVTGHFGSRHGAAGGVKSEAVAGWKLSLIPGILMGSTDEEFRSYKWPFWVKMSGLFISSVLKSGMSSIKSSNFKASYSLVYPWLIRSLVLNQMTFYYHVSLWL